jgi:hypothetical protein
MEEKNKPAFPIKSVEYDGGDQYDVIHEGLTKREYFAAMAGEPPEWFIHKPIEEKYPSTPNWNDIKDEEHKKLCMDWVHDGYYDLPEELTWFSDKFNKAIEERAEWNYKNIVSRYFQWKTFYADELLAKLTQTEK